MRHHVALYMSARGDCFEGVSQPAATVLKEAACGVSAISHALSVELLVLLVVIFWRSSVK